MYLSEIVITEEERALINVAADSASASIRNRALQNNFDTLESGMRLRMTNLVRDIRMLDANNAK